jgi:hypothetical protein
MDWPMYLNFAMGGLAFWDEKWRGNVAWERGRGKKERVSFGFGRRGNQPAPFSFCRFEGDASRTRVLLGSPAKRHFRKIRGLFPRESPSKPEINLLHPRPADSRHAIPVFMVKKPCDSFSQGGGEAPSSENLPVIPAKQPRPNPKEIPCCHVLRTAGRGARYPISNIQHSISMACQAEGMGTAGDIHHRGPQRFTEGGDNRGGVDRINRIFQDFQDWEGEGPAILRGKMAKAAGFRRGHT